MSKNIRSLAVAFLGIAFLVMAPVARAETVQPDELVRRLASEVTNAVRNDPELQNPNSPKIADIVGRLIVPRFDFLRITQFAMGRNWAKATPQEQKEIVEQFSRLLTRTYSNAIASLKELDIEVKGTKANSNANDVTVKTQMIGRPQPVAIDYSLINSAGGWKVYDVTVEGISLIAAYRDEFGSLVSSSGVSGLIDVLKKKNGE
jgi:phospholipid transport system substrate-binding protein